MKLLSVYGTVLYEGQAPSFTCLIEKAIQDDTDLRQADFSNMDLSKANMDSYDFSGGYFKNTNLTDTNLSEAILRNCRFENARLFDTCFCESDFTGSYFRDCSFGCTDFAYTSLDKCLFEGTGFFDINLQDASSLQGTSYKYQGQRYSMSAAPIILKTPHQKFLSFDYTTISQYGSRNDDLHSDLQKLKTTDQLT